MDFPMSSAWLSVFFIGFEFDRLSSVPSLGPQFLFGTMRGRVYDCLDKFVITRSLDGLWSYNSSWLVLGIEWDWGWSKEAQSPYQEHLWLEPQLLDLSF